MSDLTSGHRPAAGPAEMMGLREASGHLIRRAQQRHTVLWSREFRGVLTGPQYAVISAISADSGLDQRAVGERASLDKSSAADVVVRLQSQGWLRLAQDRMDGRRKLLSLTPLARTALSDITRRAELVQQRLLAPVPAAGQDAFLDVLRQVAYAGVPPEPGRVDEQVLLLGHAPGHLIRRCQQRHTMAWGEEIGRAMTAPQYAVLSALWGHPEGIDQGTGAELASLDKSSMADIVRRLVTRGWVVRTRDPADARRRLLGLTDVVRRELIELTPAVRRVQQRVLAPLGTAAERDTFVDGLRALAYAEDVDLSEGDRA